MCWSGEASAALAAVGFASTIYAVRRKDSPLLWLPLGYFSLMELLQAFTYSVIDQCGLPSNQIATLLGYLHICFQPFFINAVALYFIDQQVAKKIAPFAYTVCFVAAIMMLIKLYPFPWAEPCDPAIRPMCGDLLCAIHGTWHIAWSVPINAIANYVPFYAIAGFLLPLCYGSWRWTIYHMLTGPILARLTTSNMNEWPAVWCLLSIDLLLIITNTRVRNFMYVQRWPLWNKLGAKPPTT
ncbi:MAG: DUF5765 domain-containing protein [Rickettsiales bacterium]|nr:DUF5765 domain-containing protein [Rickettsiales bacterium]